MTEITDLTMYEREITAVLPRILALFDTDALSPTRGIGDRLYWAWKLTDYPNATPQGAVHGLAALAAAIRLPWQIDADSIIRRIDAAIEANSRITASDGSLSEAFPREQSFCVTALIAFDVLCAADLLRKMVNQRIIDGWYSKIEPMIGFLLRCDETHAIISNHLATAAAALFRWSQHGDRKAAARARSFLQRILDHQSEEGWFNEYGGFDPGYETLALYYLADIHLRQPEEALQPALARSLNFLMQAAHPDGSFGGLYGSRNTRFIVPAGLEMLAAEFPQAAALAGFARRAIAGRTVPTLATMDDPNLAPMFNAYCRALCEAKPITQSTVLPHATDAEWRRNFTDAGLIIDKGKDHYTIISTKKGGAVYHFRDQKVFVNAGAVATKNGKLYTTQMSNDENHVDATGDKIAITAQFCETISERLTPQKLILLRVLCLSIFKSRAILEYVKRHLVRRLITGRRVEGTSNRRTIALGYTLSIDDEFAAPTRLTRIEPDGPFQAIHMASAGYWQIGDDRP